MLVLKGQLLIQFCPHTALGWLLTWVLRWLAWFCHKDTCLRVTQARNVPWLGLSFPPDSSCVLPAGLLLGLLETPVPDVTTPDIQPLPLLLKNGFLEGSHEKFVAKWSANTEHKQNNSCQKRKLAPSPQVTLWCIFTWWSDILGPVPNEGYLKSPMCVCSVMCDPLQPHGL